MLIGKTVIFQLIYGKINNILENTLKTCERLNKQYYVNGVKKR